MAVSSESKGELCSTPRTLILFGFFFRDSTKLGMGRGPGNAKTEYLVLELNSYFKKNIFNVLPLVDLVNKHFIKWIHELC